ncbi:helix-turn-helix domain-containing protein [Mucilaginibacter gracilis]|nr:helix-turn-helix transcriptional regulator [Mucilaginibacter gracilis]
MMNKENKTTSRTPVLDALMDEIDPLEAKRTEDRMLIAVRIGELIKERGWNKSSFAVRVEQQPSVISKWLSGIHNFTLDTLTQICVVLEVPLAELFREKPQELVFRSNFAVTGLAGTAYSRIYYGGGPTAIYPGLISTDPTYIHLEGVSDPDDWADYIRQTDNAQGMLVVPHHGSKNWQTLGTTYWVGNANDLRPKNKKDVDEDRNYALKA